MINIIKNRLGILLGWSQHYIKTDLSYLIRGGFWLSMKQFFISLSSLILAISYANLLPKEDFGIYKYILSIASILAITSLSGIDIAITQSTAKGQEGTFLTALKTKIKWGFLGVLASIALAFFYYFKNDITLATGFLILAIFIPFFESLSSYGALLIGRKDFSRLAKYSIATQAIITISIVSSLFFTKNIFFLIFIYFISFICARFLFLFLTLKLVPPNNIKDDYLISYGKQLSFMGVISLIATHFDKILVFNYMGAAELAIYTFATNPPNIISGFLGNIQTLALPKFAKQKDIKKINLKRKVIILGLAIIMIIITYISTAKFLYSVLFPQYLEAVFYTKIYALSLITAVGTLLFAFMHGQKHVKNLYKYNIVSPLINIAILLFFIRFGLIGIIIGRVINRFINLFYTFYLIKNSNNTNS